MRRKSMSPLKPHQEGPRNALQLILSLEFGSALIGKTILVTAFWAQTMLFVVLTFERTGSAAWVGLVLAAQLLPQVFLAILSGSMADKRGPRIPIVLGGLCAGTGSISLAIWLEIPALANLIPVEMPLLASSVICGVGIALASAALQAVPPRLSRPNEHATAMSLNFLPSALGRTLGPLVGAWLGSAVGPILTLAILAGICFVSASVFLLIRRLGTPSITTGGPRRLRDVTKHVWNDKPLLAAICAAAAISAAAEASVTLAPNIGSLLGIGTVGAGWVTGAFGLGGLAGILTYRVFTTFLRPQSVGLLSMVILGVSLALVGLVPSLGFATAMLILGGASMVMGITAFGVVVQQRAPAQFLGRIMAIWVMAFSGVRPVSGLVLGLVSDHVSTTSAILGAAFVAAATGVCVHLWSRSVSRRALAGKKGPVDPNVADAATSVRDKI